MDDLLQVINELHNVFLTVGLHVELDLPQIAVVGGQSVGKSSVLESIVGRSDFLPRGTGIVTRRPLVLQLHNNSNNGKFNGSGQQQQQQQQVQNQSNSQTQQNQSQSQSIISQQGSDSGGGGNHKSHKSQQQINSTGTVANTQGGSGVEVIGGSSSSSSSSSSKPQQPPLEYGQFSHLPSDRIFTDFNEIRKEIERDTERITGGKNNNCISHIPIQLRIYSPRVVDLTLLDLPGLTKIPVGSQPPDIEKRVRDLILSYIRQPNCLILAVTAGNTDIVTSDSISLAREVDPEGRRTVGVLTKCDLLDEGCDVLDVMDGRVVPLRHGYVGVVRVFELVTQLRHGYVGVVCRNAISTQTSSKSLTDAVQEESQFFRTHPVYHRIAHRCGIPYLSKTLNHLLLAHIKQALPDLSNRVIKQIQETESELSSYGDRGDLFLGHGSGSQSGTNNSSDSSTAADIAGNIGSGNPQTSVQPPQTAGEQGALLLHLVSKFARNFCDSIDGKRINTSSSSSSANYGMNNGANNNIQQQVLQQGPQICGGARIHFIFHELFSKAINDFDCFHGLSDLEIRTAIKNCTGPRPLLFVPEDAFELLIKKQISQLKEPCLQCVDAVYSELNRIVYECLFDQVQNQIGSMGLAGEMQRFSTLRDSVHDVAKGVLRKCLLPTTQMISNLIQIELAYINTNHPDFIGGQEYAHPDFIGGSNAIQASLQNKDSLNFNTGPNNQNGPNSNSLSSQYPPPPPREPLTGFQGSQDMNNFNHNSYNVNDEYHSGPGSIMDHHRDDHITKILGGGDSNIQNSDSANAVNIDQIVSNSDNNANNNTTATVAAPSGGLFGFLRGSGSSSSTTTTQTSGTSNNGGSNAAAAAGNQTTSTTSDNHLMSDHNNISGTTVSGVSNNMYSNQIQNQSHNHGAMGVIKINPSNTTGPKMSQIPHFLSGLNPSGSLGSTHNQNLCERERIEVCIIKTLISSYFNQVVKKNILDAVPKSIMFFMVNTSRDVLQREIVTQLYKPELFPQLLEESKDIEERRVKCRERLKVLREGLGVLMGRGKIENGGGNRIGGF